MHEEDGGRRLRLLEEPALQLEAVGGVDAGLFVRPTDVVWRVGVPGACVEDAWADETLGGDCERDARGGEGGRGDEGGL